MATERIVPMGWEREVDAAIDEFLLQTKASKKRFGLALGITASSLTLSHLENTSKQKYIFHRLLSCLRADNIFLTAHRLHLDIAGWRALKRLSARILSSSYPYLIDPERLLDNSVEALEIGMLGVSCCKPEQWTAAVTHLQYAWEYFQRLPTIASTTELYVRLRVGAQLASLQSASGAFKLSFATAQETLRWARAYSGPDTKVREAICWLYNTAGTTWRHAGKHPQFAIERHQIADKMIAAGCLPQTHRIPILRNQAKPYAQWALRDDNRRSECFRAAISTISESVREAGGNSPFDDVHNQWLLSRLTHIECLVAMRDDVGAERLWDETMEIDWVASMVSCKSDTELSAKWEFVRMAILLARKNFDELAVCARSFKNATWTAPFGERQHRATQFAELAEEHQEIALRALIVR